MPAIARMRANPYIVTNVGWEKSVPNVVSAVSNRYHHTSAPFDWPKLKHYLKEKILGLAFRRVVEERHNERRLPDHLRPPEIQHEPEQRYAKPWPETIQKLVFERPREDILEMAGGLLTVTFHDCVDRTWRGFARYAALGLTLDPDAVCAAINFRQTWTAVRKIRLRLVGNNATDPLRVYWFQVVRQREGDGQDEIINASWLFEIRPARKDALERRFVEELKLTHAVVDGEDEWSV